MNLTKLLTSIFFLIVTPFKLIAVELVDIKEFPEWFKDSITREVKVSNSSNLTIEDFKINNKVLGNVSLEDHSEGVWYYNIDAGLESPVECYVFSTFDGAANSLYSIVELSLEGVSDLNELPLASKFNFAVNSGIIADTPYLLLDTLYILQKDQKKVIGTLKALSARTDNSLQICVHNAVGFRQSFLNVFESFISAFTDNEENPEFFESIHQLSINDIPAGYAREKFSLDGDGDVNIQVDTAFIIPVDENSIARSDTVSYSWSSPDGSLINANEYAIENDILTSQFTISSKDEMWNISGTLQGKEIEQTLEYNDWLLSDYGSYIETKNLVNSDNNSAELHMWSSDIDPTSALKVIFSKVSNKADSNFKLTMGPMEMYLTVDETGVIKKGSWGQGPASMGIKLLYANGEPSLK